MATRCYVSTRKGLFTVDRGPSKWSVSHAAFVGDNVTLTTHDPRNGDLFAALNHGHFGIKLHRSRDGGETWPEIAVPAYPPMPQPPAPSQTYFPPAQLEARAEPREMSPIEEVRESLREFRDAIRDLAADRARRRYS